MPDDGITRHCGELDRCNQRGGRMLSVFDLLEAETLDLDLAAFMMSRIMQGASFLVGARPGGAGKTTVMCALLNLIPHPCEIVAATASAVRDAARKEIHGRRCFVCHEIGSGPYFAYLWDGRLRAYCALAEKGHLLATNLHADDLDEARAQICGENGVPASHFNAFHLAVFLRVRGGYSGARHWVEKVYMSDGVSTHALVFDKQGGLARFPRASEVDCDSFERCRAFLAQGLKNGIRTIEDTRREVLGFLSARQACV